MNFFLKREKKTKIEISRNFEPFVIFATNNIQIFFNFFGFFNDHFFVFLLQLTKKFKTKINEI